MELIADMMLVAATLGAGLYCVTLSRRLTRFNSLENGVGGAIAVLSAQVDGMTKTLQNARDTAQTERETLEALTTRAEDIAKKLELLVASMHDLPVEPAMQEQWSEVQNEMTAELAAPKGNAAPAGEPIEKRQTFFATRRKASST